MPPNCRYMTLTRSALLIAWRLRKSWPIWTRKNEELHPQTWLKFSTFKTSETENSRLGCAWVSQDLESRLWKVRIKIKWVQHWETYAAVQPRTAYPWEARYPEFWSFRRKGKLQYNQTFGGIKADTIRSIYRRIRCIKVCMTGPEGIGGYKKHSLHGRVRNIEVHCIEVDLHIDQCKKIPSNSHVDWHVHNCRVSFFCMVHMTCIGYFGPWNFLYIPTIYKILGKLFNTTAVKYIHWYRCDTRPRV